MNQFEEFPPLSPKIGRRHTIAKSHRGIAIDTALDNLLTEEALRSQVTISRMLDVILWHHFGKPKLSFEDANVCTESPKP